MFRKLKIGNKLALIMIGLSLIAIAMLSTLFFVQFDRSLKERVLLQLSSVKQLKIVKIRAELQDRYLAFQQHLQDIDVALQEPDELFYKVELVNSLPTDIVTAINDSIPNLTNHIIMVDVTPNNIQEDITIALITYIDNQFFVAYARVPEVQAILLERTGLGQTGESYVVGGDYKLRTRSRFYSQNPRSVTVQTEGVKRALADQPGEDLIIDYRGMEVFSAYEKIEMHGIVWVILTEINHEEALFPVEELKTNFIYILIIILLFVLMVSYLLSGMLVKPIVEMEGKLIGMSRGILKPANYLVEREDEIGQMFNAAEKLTMALRETILFAGEIGSGNFDAKFTPLSKRDKLGSALIRMKERLKDFKENEDRLLKENQRSMLNGEESERSRISKDLHDGIGPLLTTLKMTIQSGDLDEPSKKAALTRIDEIIREVRRISNNLMPSVLNDFGAGEAIGNLLQEIRENTSVKIHYRNDMPLESPIEDTINITLYRVAQEAINNAIRHSKATELKVSITRFEDHIGFFLADNGKGFDTSKNNRGNGLKNMKERIKLVNGNIEIRSTSKGTSIEAEIPIP